MTQETTMNEMTASDDDSNEEKDDQPVNDDTVDDCETQLSMFDIPTVSATTH